MYLSSNLSPFSEVYLYLKFTVTGQFVLTVCAFHGYALVGVLFSITNMTKVNIYESHTYLNCGEMNQVKMLIIAVI